MKGPDEVNVETDGRSARLGWGRNGAECRQAVGCWGGGDALRLDLAD
jgi:hypothetical protein